MKIDNPKGTRDFNPEEMGRRRRIEDRMRTILAGSGYKEVSTPIFEYVELFEVKSGEDIKNRMYVFEEKGGRRVCLRPELTASVCRMFAWELKNRRKPLRLFYSGPMFRYEEPQKGRYREFYQVGVELIGVPGVLADAEVIVLACECLDSLGLKYCLQLNSLDILRRLLDGLDVGVEDQNKVIALLDEGKRDALGKLIDSDVLARLIEVKGGLSSIDEAQKVLEGFEGALSALTALSDTCLLLEAAGVDYTIDFSIARGLEYYTGVVFEVRVEGLGAQSQICGGGRYDRLIEDFGGPETPAVGFAFGFDRVCEALELQGVELEDKCKTVIVAPVSSEVSSYALKVASTVRSTSTSRDVSVELELAGRKLKRVLEDASSRDVDYVLIVGGKEEDEGSVTVRDMMNNSQDKVPLSDVSERLF